MTVADAALLLAGARTMTALLEIGEDDAAIANFAASVALRAFDGAASVAFFTGHVCSGLEVLGDRKSVV